MPEYQTLFYQGIFCSYSHAAKYVSAQHGIKTSTGQHVFCKNKNNLQPLNALINPFVGEEIKDVNVKPFHSFASYFNPLKLFTASIAKFTNWYHRVQISDPDKNMELREDGDLRTYALNVSEISIGQATDIESHYKKYCLWKEMFPNDYLILWGVSRGAATTFNAYAKYLYPEVKLVILEGCFYELKDVFSESFYPLSLLIHSCAGYFTQYRKNGPSPATNIQTFPENVPVVFISSAADKVIPYNSTKKLAQMLAARKKNDVYLLKLERSSHPNYMFDDPNDRNRYEAFIHAIYKKYHFPYISELAKNGEKFLQECFLYEKSI